MKKTRVQKSHATVPLMVKHLEYGTYLSENSFQNFPSFLLVDMILRIYFPSFLLVREIRGIYLSSFLLVAEIMRIF